MEKIFAPWRIEYIGKKKDSCIFCDALNGNDKENLILSRGKKNFIIMNSYPYTNGHLMVAPLRHVTDIEELDEDERKEHLDMVIKAKSLLKVLKPDSFNIGMNLGKESGAGFDHVHTHIVPRWKGDTNFMPVIADTKVISEALKSTYKRLEEQINK